MSAQTFNDLVKHYGHNVSVVMYADTNVAVECEECYEVIVDFDKEETE